MKRRLLSTLLVFGMVLALLPTAAFAAGNDAITRVQLAVKLQQHPFFGLSEQTGDSVSGFKDIGDCSAMERNAIAAVAESRIINGITASIFAPYDIMTREQLAVMLFRAWHFTDGSSEIPSVDLPYQDNDHISAWATDGIKAPYALGVLDKTDMDQNGNFDPTGYATVKTADKWLLALTGAPMPDAAITRVQLAVKLQQLPRFGLSGWTSDSASQFTDLHNCDEVERNAIGVLVDVGFISGIGNDKFDPYNTLTRGAIATILWRAADVPGNPRSLEIPYQDVPGGRYYTDAIKCLYAAGILDDTDMDKNGNFCPDDVAAVGTVDKWLATLVSSGGSMGDDGALTWLYSGGAEQITITGPVSPSEPVYVAVYDENDKMLEIRAITFSGGNAKVGDRFHHIKVMWVGADTAPKCENAEITAAES